MSGSASGSASDPNGYGFASGQDPNASPGSNDAGMVAPTAYAGQQQQQGLAGLLGGTTTNARGPNDAAYTAQMQKSQQNANTYGGLATGYTQQGPTISNQFQGQSQANIAGNIGSEQGTAAAQGNLAQSLMQNNGEASKAQFQSGLDQGINAQMAMANSAQGGAVAQAGARRAAQQQGGAMQAQGAATAAQLGAQEREASLAQAGNVLQGQAGTYGQVGNQLQQQYGLEQGDAQQQAQLDLANQGQQNQMRLGYGALGNQSQGQAEGALNDYTGQSLQAQGLSAGINKSNSQATNDLLGGVVSGIGSIAGGLLAQGGTMTRAAGGPVATSTWGTGTGVQPDQMQMPASEQADWARAGQAGQGMMTGLGMAGVYGAPGYGQVGGMNGVYGGLRAAGVPGASSVEARTMPVRQAPDPGPDPYQGLEHNVGGHRHQVEARSHRGGEAVAHGFQAVGQGISGARAAGGGVDFLSQYESDQDHHNSYGGSGGGMSGMASKMGGMGGMGSTGGMGMAGAAAGGGSIANMLGTRAPAPQSRASLHDALRGMEHLRARVRRVG